MRQRPIRNTILTVLVCFFAMAGTTNAKTIYVDGDAAGANDGSNWADAYNYLQDALTFASAGDEIRVAQGVYRPDEFVLSKRPNLGREESFQLRNGVTLKGGYAGFGEPDPNARDFTAYETILSGDLDGNDVEVADPCDLRTEPTRAENSYHVVTASEVDETAILDGFTISAGNANGPVTWPDYDYKNSQGGGVYINSGSPKFIDCTFEHNTARNEGGAIHSTFQSSPTLVRCAFKENAANTGGGMCSHWHYPDNLILVDCTFAGNVATLSGGGIHGYGTLTNCTLSGNRAPRGGGLRIEGDPTLTNCAFIGNLADVAGGGIYNLDTAGPTLVRCRFIENVAWQRDEEGYISGVGGGMYNDESNPRLISCAFIGNIAVAGGGMRTDYYPTFTNCVFSGNLSDQGGGLYIDSGWGIIALTNCTFSWNLALASIGNQIRCEGSSETVLMNCIFWGGTPFQANEIYLVGHPNPNITPTLTVNYTCIRGGKSAVYVGEQCTLKWGESNIDLDPCFADPGYWDPNDMPEDANDDFWVDGDYHLKSQAGRWDASEGRWIIDDVTSPCIDAGDPMSPVGYEPFPNGGIINMGAYGGTTEASKSYFGKPSCEIIVAGDINGDCEVNFLDFRLLALHWLEEH